MMSPIQHLSSTRTLAAAFALGSLALTACAGDTGSPAATGYGEMTLEEINRVENGLLPRVRVVGESGWTIEERMDRWNVEGVSVAVIQEFDVVWARAYGLADREEGIPVTTETLFQAGSISKPVGATGALRLVEEGKLTLDKPINEILQTWQLPENELTAESPVTIRRLLSHTAGTTVHGFPGYPPWEGVPTTQQVLDGEGNTAPVRVDLEPGTQLRYSGGGITIVQLAMTDVTGEAYPDLLERLVLEPAGMAHSTYENPLPAERLSEAAAGYRRDGSAVPGKRHTYPEMHAAGLWTTASDLARFAIAMQNSLRGEAGGVLRPATAQEMTTPVMEGSGLGFFMNDEGGTVYFGHNGADEGFQALLLASQNDGYGIAVMANSDNGSRIAMEILRAVALEYDWRGILDDPVSAIELSADQLAEVAGRYRWTGPNVVTISVENGVLVSRVTLENASSRVFPIGQDVFLREESGLQFQILRGTDGAATGVEIVDGESFARLEGTAQFPAELLDARRTDEAVAALDSGNAPEGMVNQLGYALLGAGRPEQAVAVFELNTRKHAGHANPWDSLADGYLAVGDTAAAIVAYRTVLQTIPLDADTSPEARANLEQRARAQLAAFGAE